MKYGVLSDIHGNLEAFDAAMARLKAEGAEKYIFCGDLVGYGPDPENCVKKYMRLQQDGLAVGVMGNHDAVFSHPELREYFNFEALKSLDWSAENMSKQSMRLVSFLPEVVHGNQFTAVHGTPMEPIKEYFASAQQYRTAYNLWNGQLLFVGHSHLSFFMEGNEKRCRVHVVRIEETLPLLPAYRYVINPGSVGKPRDNDARASFGIWDDTAHTFRFLRQAYDYSVTQEKMRVAGMPPFLIACLGFGM